MKKQDIQENYFTEAAVILLFLLILSFLLIHIDSCAKSVTKTIVQSDFTLITGGERQTFGGGYITYLYLLTIVFLAITLLQEQLILNDWIDSTQMASQNSELLVTNTLYIKMLVHTSQISLGQDTQEKNKINLCDTEILKLEQNLDYSGSVDYK